MLNQKQKNQVVRQLELHKHKRYQQDMMIDSLVLPNFLIYPEVFRADIMTSSIYTAKFLVQNPSFYRNKHVLDMGCGSGILGIVMALNGAGHVTFSDMSRLAVRNTLENVQRYTLEHKVTILQGDLFERVSGRFDFIVFNHPFFADEKGFPEQPVSKSMVAKPELIHRFLEETKNHLTKEAKIIMPFLELAGETNDPKVQGPKHDYKVEEVYSANVESGVQTGFFYVYELMQS